MRERLPPIILAAADADRLSALAMAAQHVNPDLADFLEGELERATIVGSADLVPAGVVRLGSEVVFRDEPGGRTARVRLVLPEQADMAQGRISVLTPVGAALIGMAAGKSIDFAAHRGRRRLTVLQVIDDAPVAAR